MLIALLLLLSAGPPTPPPTPPGQPVFTPEWYGFPPQQHVYVRFNGYMAELPPHLKPSSSKDWKCVWAAWFSLTLKAYRWRWMTRVRATHERLHKFIEKNCHDSDGNFQGRFTLILDFLLTKHGKELSFVREQASAEPPFELPALPDRAGGDVGDPLWPMFISLEKRLAKGGHRLTGEARACAWATSALNAASAVQRSPGATEGIGAGVKVLDGRVALHCQGDALKAKDAAWNWLRANPAATQPLVVANRPPTPPWPTPTPADGALWLGTALLFLGPEAWPAILIAVPAK